MKHSQPKWNKSDTRWMLGLYGTSIGAGVLFLPINAGIGGLIPLLIMLILAYPITYLGHFMLCQFILMGSRGKEDSITEVGENLFGKSGGVALTILYFLSIFPILLVYGVSVTNTIESFITEQLKVSSPNRLWLSFFLVGLFILIVSFGRDIIIKIMSAIVYPFIIVLIIISLWLIPNWNTALFQNINLMQTFKDQHFWYSLWLLMPVMVFSFSHVAIISSLAVYCKEKYGKNAEKKSSDIISRSNILMVATVMFFVFSCALCLGPNELKQAKEENVSILTYLANYFKTPFLYWLGPIIASIAMAKSFFGHYLGAKEGLNKIISYTSANKIKKRYVDILTTFITFLVTWTIAYKNPNVLDMIESINGPIFAIMLFIMPTCTLYIFSQKYRHKYLQNISLIIFGIIVISASISGIIRVYHKFMA